MPRTPKKPLGEPSASQSPYSSTPDKADIKPSVTTPSDSGGKAAAWTGEGLVTLFRFAMDRNGRDWGGAVERRTASQARQTWAKRILPFLEKGLLERGGA